MRDDGAIYRWYVNQPPAFAAWLASKEPKLDNTVSRPDEQPLGTTVRSLRRDRYPSRDAALERFQQLGVEPVSGVFHTATQWYCYHRPVTK